MSHEKAPLCRANKSEVQFEALCENDSVYRTALSLVAQAVMVADIPSRNVTILYCQDETARKLFTIPSGPGSHIASGLIHPEDTERYRDFFDKVYTGVTYVECSIRLRRCECEWIWYDLLAHTLPEDVGFPKRSTLLLKELASEERKRDIAQGIERDSLSGLFTKKSFEGRVNDLLKNDRRTQGGHLFTIDIDHLKEINEKYGYILGNEVIKCVARAIRDGFRSEDILGHAGGSRFMAFVGNMGTERAEARAAQLCKTLSQMEFSKQIEKPVELSIGIAEANAYDGFASLNKKAEKALARVKQSNDCCWVVCG